MTTILVVDDEIQDRKLLEAQLRPEGYLTLGAASGKEALDRVAQQAPDLILLDVMMSDMDGYTVAGILKHDPATSNIPIILLTASIDGEARLAGLAAGAEDFVTKPVDRVELSLRVRNLLRLKALGDLVKERGSLLETQVQAGTIELQGMRTAMDATADAIVLVNRSTMQIVEVNRTASDMLGYSRAELLRMNRAQLGVETQAALEGLYDRIIAGDPPKAASETEVRRKDGSLLAVEMHGYAQRSGSDWIIIAVLRDLTERKEFGKQLDHLTHYDTLTGLPNRTLFHETLEKSLVEARSAGCVVAVLLVGIDHFKDVNAALGHDVGDNLLSEVGERLAQCVRVRGTVGRMDGTEFAVILVMTHGQQGAAVVAGKIRDAIREPFVLHGHEVSVTASIGITLSPDDSADPATLMQYADTAMRRAKHSGRDSFRFFTAQMNIDVLARLELEAALRRAIEHEEFVLYYQPKMQLLDGRISGLEALLRWERPGRGVVLPEDFIPVLEESGLIVEVGKWVIASVCKQMAAWSRSSIGNVHVAVNVAARQFIDGDLDQVVLDALTENDVAGEYLELELTENTLMVNTEQTITRLQNVKQRGVQISVDDFGTGYSSLAYLRRFPIDKLKIDIAFVRGITTDPDDAPIALTIIRMAHSLKLVTIAEGVETLAQLDFLRFYGCDEIQGYYFSLPLPLPEVERMLRDDALQHQARAHAEQRVRS